MQHERQLSDADLIRNELDLKYAQSVFLKYVLLLGLRERMPSSIRNRAGASFSFRQLRNPKRDFPVDKKVQTLEDNALKDIVSQKKYHAAAKHWPGFAACFTHDVDTDYDLKEGISVLRNIEKRHKIKSTWNFVPESGEYVMDRRILESLESEGHEIAAHGLKHDGRFAFVSRDERRMRIKRSKEIFKEAGFNVRGFRAPWLHRTRDMIPFLEENEFIWDSSAPDTDRTTIGYRGTGCSTVFPFHPMIKENETYRESAVVELPVTVPQDWCLIYPMRLTDEGILSMWKSKIDYIEGVGGLALLLTHPARYDIGSSEKSWIYDEIMRYVKDKKPFTGRCIDIAERWRAVNSAGMELDERRMQLKITSEKRIRDFAFYVFSPRNEMLRGRDCELLKSETVFNKNRSLFLVRNLEGELALRLR